MFMCACACAWAYIRMHVSLMEQTCWGGKWHRIVLCSLEIILCSMKGRCLR